MIHWLHLENHDDLVILSGHHSPRRRPRHCLHRVPAHLQSSSRERHLGDTPPNPRHIGHNPGLLLGALDMYLDNPTFVSATPQGARTAFMEPQTRQKCALQRLLRRLSLQHHQDKMDGHVPAGSGVHTC